MAISRMPPAKSHLLAYIKHTPGFENLVWSYVDLSIPEILSRFRERDEQAYRACVAHFRQELTDLEPLA